MTSTGFEEVHPENSSPSPAMGMNDAPGKYRISKWLAEFSDRETERAFHRYIGALVVRQLRIALVVWGVLLMLFAIPDYIILGATRTFYEILAGRVTFAVILFAAFLMITPKRDFFKISVMIAVIIIIGFTGFMTFFVYFPDSSVLIIMLIMLMLLYVQLFLPIRFIVSFMAALYGVVITLLTRWIMGVPIENLVILFVLLMLPFAAGTVTAMRFAIMNRRQYALMARTEATNLKLQEALGEIKQLTGMLPICASCKKIRNDKGYWEQIEVYIGERSDAEFSHGICPDCARKLYPELYKNKPEQSELN